MTGSGVEPQDALQALRETGMVASSRLATRDDITRLLGLEHVDELEHTYGVAALPLARRWMVRDTTSAVLWPHLRTAREEMEWGRCGGARRSPRR
jgi:hypothetical protein